VRKKWFAIGFGVGTIAVYGFVFVMCLVGNKQIATLIRTEPPIRVTED
jgi:hypothetical protein